MKKIVILSPGLFLKRDYKRLGVEFLRKSCSVTILDLTAWIYPNFWKKYHNKIYQCEEYVSISCKDDFLKLSFSKNSIIVLDFERYDKHTNWVRKQLKKLNSLFFFFETNMIPETSLNFNKILSKIIKSIYKPSKIFKFIKTQYLSSKINFSSDILVLGGLVAPRKKKFKNILNAHSMEYDIYLDLKNKPEKKTNPYAVFLDADLTSHLDYSMLNLTPPTTEDQYYPILLNFFKKFEIKTGFKIKFAVHPKSCNKNLNNLLKGIDYSYGNTAELIKNSKAILLHSSTALSYAVLFNKPAIFLTSNQLSKSWLGVNIEAFAKSVNGSIINIDNNLDKELSSERLLTIDTNKYKSYLDHYLKFPNTKDVLLWKIIEDYIKKNDSRKEF